MSGGFEGFTVVVAAEGTDRGREVASALEQRLGDLDVLTVTDIEQAVDRVQEGAADGLVVGREHLEGLDGVERLADATDGAPVVVELPEHDRAAKADAVAAGATAAVGPLEAEAPLDLLANRLDLALSGTAADRTAREAQQRYHRLLEASPAAIVIYDAEGTLLYANAAAADLVGADDPHDIVGKELSAFATEESMDVVAERFETVIENRERAPSREYPIVGLDGERRYVEAAGSPVTVDGEPGGQAVLTDITELKEREERFRTERDRFTALFEALPEPAVHVEYVEGTPYVRNVNPAFEEVFGFAAEDLTGEPLNEHIVPEGREAEAERIDERTRDGERIQRSVTRRTADGDREFLYRAQSFDTPGGSNEGVGIYIDVTEQKRREDALERQNERLDAFASIVSHDLRSPLSVAMGNLHLAEEEDDPEYLRNVESALDRMEQIIEDLLRLARRGEESTETQPVTARTVVREAWTSLDSGDATLENDLDGTLEADPGQLRELLENLFRNAVEHAGPSVTVDVGALDDGFYVADDGPGIPEDEREAVFEPGYTTAEEGTGFGLVVVKEIATAHGWDVDVTESEAGGARFEFRGVDVGE